MLQLFIEKRSDRGAKHLHVVNIESISASIRTHGTGMMNTTVSFAYQFLRRKFFRFSQFLFDDYIRSHLSREIRFFERQRQKLKNMYPHENAHKFTRDIMKLGMGTRPLHTRCMGVLIALTISLPLRWQRELLGQVPHPHH